MARNPARYRDLRDDLVAANMGMTLDCYVIRSILASALFGFIWAVVGFLVMRLAILPEIGIRVYNVFALQLPALFSTDTSFLVLHIVVSVLIFVIAVNIALLFFRTYPSLLKKERATRINLLLHNAVAYIYAMRRGGTEMMAVFRSVSRETFMVRSPTSSGALSGIPTTWVMTWSPRSGTCRRRPHLRNCVTFSRISYRWSRVEGM